MKTNSKSLLYALVAAFGAFVVGLNLGGISGAIDLIEQEFALSAMAKGLVASALMIGCFFGALFGGRLSDKYGRKPMMAVSAVLLAAAAIACFFATNAAVLIVFRLIAGLGVGILSAVVPTYITEISPADKRGTYVSFYQLSVVIGILVAYIANWLFVNTSLSWRLMLGLPLVFALIDILVLIPLPESPRWLVQNGRMEKAESAMQTFRLDEKDRSEILATAGQKKEKNASFSELFKGKMGKVVFLGSMLAFFQQMAGINVIISYAPGILSSIGVAGGEPLLQTILVGAANLVFTVIALWLCDKFGRKTLLVSGCAGLSLSLAYLVYAFSTPNPSSVGILIAIIAYIAFFALSLSPLMFVVTSEMYPSHIRGTAMSLSTGISWVCAFLVVQLFPWMKATLGSAVSFAIFMIICIAAGIFIQFCIPETRGKKLEEIEKELGL